MFLFSKTTEMAMLNVKAIGFKKNGLNMKSFKPAACLLLSLQPTLSFSVPIELDQVPASGQVADSTAGSMAQAITPEKTTELIPPPPPGPYSSSALSSTKSSAAPSTLPPATAGKETVISKPIQMPASMPPVNKQVEPLEKQADSQAVSVEKPVAKAPMPAFSPDVPWPEDADISESSQVTKRVATPQMQNQISETRSRSQAKPHSSPARTRNDGNIKPDPRVNRPTSPMQNPRWSSAPPSPPGPYGFVPNYVPRYDPRPAMDPRSNMGDNYSGYNNPGNRSPSYGNPGSGYGNQGYGQNKNAPDIRYQRPSSQAPMNQGPMYPAPYPQMRNPAHAAPDNFYGYPNQRGNNSGQRGDNQGQKGQGNVNQYNSNQSDMNQGRIYQQPQNRFNSIND